MNSLKNFSLILSILKIFEFIKVTMKKKICIIFSKKSIKTNIILFRIFNVTKEKSV